MRYDLKFFNIVSKVAKYIWHFTSTVGTIEDLYQTFSERLGNPSPGQFILLVPLPQYKNGGCAPLNRRKEELCRKEMNMLTL